MPQPPTNKSDKKPLKKAPSRPSRSKASKPRLTPLEPHLAQLLNPALAPGFNGLEADVEDDALAPSGGPLAGPSGTTEKSLEELLRLGDPNLRDAEPWKPHRPDRPPKSEGGVRFELVSEYSPKGDQPTAIAELVKGIKANERDQVLLGVTGSGKTFTIQGNDEHPGLVPRGLVKLFEIIDDQKAVCKVDLSCYMVEIYLGELRDLLLSKGDPVKELEIHET